MGLTIYYMIIIKTLFLYIYMQLFFGCANESDHIKLPQVFEMARIEVPAVGL